MFEMKLREFRRGAGDEKEGEPSGQAGSSGTWKVHR